MFRLGDFFLYHSHEYFNLFLIIVMMEAIETATDILVRA